MSAGVALSVGTGAAQGQWTVTNLGAGRAFGVDGGYQAGNRATAGRWSGTAESFTSLALPVVLPWITQFSAASGMSGNMISGSVTQIDDVRTTTRAVSWNAVTGAVTVLASGIQYNWPNSSGASATDGSRTVGYHFMLGNPGNHAMMWTGPGAALDLHPPSMAGSSALGAHAGQQVGQASIAGGPSHASLWSGTASSWVDLQPVDSTQSSARGVHSGQQVGYARFGTADHAGVWTGSAASWVDLHPAGATVSQATAVFAGIQIGYATVGGVEHASLWNGSAESWEDLTLALTGSWGNTRAQGISSDGSTLSIVGYGRNLTTNQDEALIWARPIPSPGATVLLGLSGLWASRRRRRGG